MKTPLFKLQLAVICFLCSLYVNAHDFEVDGIYYNITSVEDKTVEVTFSGDHIDDVVGEYTGTVIIPDSVIFNGVTYNVTSIGNNALDYCRLLESVVIPNSVLTIGD